MKNPHEAALELAQESLNRYYELRDVANQHRDDFPELGPYMARGAAGGVIKSPYFRAARQELDTALRLYAELGYTPAPRQPA